MKIKNIFLILGLFLPPTAKAQLHHTVDLNVNIYSNLYKHFDYNKIYSLQQNVSLPEFSYKLFYKKHGVEAYYNSLQKNYGRTFPQSNQFGWISQNMVGLNYNYRIYTLKEISFTTLVGISFIRYNTSKIEYEYNVARFTSGGFPRSTFGLQLGTNITVPVWRGLYVNSNIRYTNVPWAKNPIYQNNLLVNVGLGYQFGHRK